MLRLVDEAVEQYCLNHSTPETELYEELRKETYASMDIPQMLAGQLVVVFYKCSSVAARHSASLRLVHLPDTAHSRWRKR